MKKTIIILNGGGGVGKDTFCMEMKNHFQSNYDINSTKISIVDDIKKAAMTLGWDGVSKTEKDRKFLSDLMDLSTEYNNHSYKKLMDRVRVFKDDVGANILFIDIREPNVIAKLKKEVENKNLAKVYTILIKRLNLKEIKSNHADGNVDNFEYDFVIYNNSTLEDFKKCANTVAWGLHNGIYENYFEGTYFIDVADDEMGFRHFYDAQNEFEHIQDENGNTILKVPTKTRGFEIAKGFEDKDVQIPKRSTKYSAGYDFFAIEDTVIEPWEKIHAPVLVKTGIKAYMPNNEVLYMYNRSSNPIKRGLVLSNSVGVVDSDYYNNPDNDGHIMFAFYNMTKLPEKIKKGDKIGQGVFGTYLKADNDKAEGERIGGYGSTGE